VPLDPRTPVLVGAGQALQRPATVEEAVSPAQLMADAVRRAGADSGGRESLVRRADSIRVVDLLSWRYANVAAAVAELVGASPRQTLVTRVGGNSPQLLIDQTAASITAGDLDVAVLCGGEAMYSRVLARKSGSRLAWPVQGEDVAPPDRVGDDRPGTNQAEQARSLGLPVQMYPLFECALRAAAGETIPDHQVRVSELWARFSAVAATNPWAWSQEPRSALEIRTVGPDNRMVGFPYPKLMNANLQTDQAAALLLCSAEAADGAGVPRDRWVFPWSGAEAHDHWFVSDRWDLHSSPAIAACGRAALQVAGVTIDDIAHVDLYSCFPSAVQFGAAALRLPLDDPDRTLTVTGGLGFAGGPGNNYVTHAVATMMSVLRQDPGSFGLVTALGWYATKHAIGVYRTEPPPDGFGWRSVQDEVDALPSRRPDADYAGPVVIEASTVLHERDGSPSLGILACLTPAGLRSWANTRDADLMQVLVTEDLVGRSATLRSDGDIDLAG
jgi:acetyl-CoA C-acetyltransferase